MFWGEAMLSTLPSRPSYFRRFRVTKALSPLSLGIILLTSVGMPAQAQFGGFPTQSPTTQVIGSPIPSPVPVVPGSMNPYSLSPYNSNPYYNPNNSYYNPYNYNGYNQGIITPGSGVIQNSTLINPTVINSGLVIRYSLILWLLIHEGIPEEYSGNPRLSIIPLSIIDTISLELGFG